MSDVVRRRAVRARLRHRSAGRRPRGSPARGLHRPRHDHRHDRRHVSRADSRRRDRCAHRHIRSRCRALRDGDGCPGVRRARSPRADDATLRDSPPTCGGELGTVIGRCLEKTPANRYQSMHDLAFHLEVISSRELDAISGVNSRPATGLSSSEWVSEKVPTKAPRGQRRSRWVGGLALLATSAIGAALGFVIARRAQPEAATSAQQPSYTALLTFSRGRILSVRYASDAHTIVLQRVVGRRACAALHHAHRIAGLQATRGPRRRARDLVTRRARHVARPTISGDVLHARNAGAHENRRWRAARALAECARSRLGPQRRRARGGHPIPGWVSDRIPSRNGALQGRSHSGRYSCITPR